MNISTLRVESLRVIERADLAFSPSLNFIVGDNGSGKSSLLEAVYLAARGRSFRSRNARPVIRDGEAAARIIADIHTDQGAKHRVGVEKGKSHHRARLNGRDLSRMSDLARELPVALITPESTEWVAGPPDIRRQFYDYLVFHVEHPHLSALQRYSNLLRQRNAALAARSSRRLVTAWDQDLVATAQILHEHRLRHFQPFAALVNEWWAKRWQGYSLQVDYLAGYDTEQGLQAQLDAQFERDHKRGFTGSGAHRFDLKLSLDKAPAKDVMSRGQQKYLAVCATVSSAILMADVSRRLPVVLFDDLSAELDESAQQLVLEGLTDLGCQMLVTATSKSVAESFQSLQPRMFHVEHGRFEQF